MKLKNVIFTGFLCSAISLNAVASDYIPDQEELIVPEYTSVFSDDTFGNLVEYAPNAISAKTPEEYRILIQSTGEIPNDVKNELLSDWFVDKWFPEHIVVSEADVGRGNDFDITDEMIVNFRSIERPRNILDILESEKRNANKSKCPFDTKSKCDIWKTKPTVNENTYDAPKTMRMTYLDKFIMQSVSDKNFCANKKIAKPFVNAYKNLMNMSNICCTETMVHKLKTYEIKPASIYTFLADDANYYHATERCLAMTDAQLDEEFPLDYAIFIADTRNSCLCKNRDAFEYALQPFAQLYDLFPEFAEFDFKYTYTDDLGRETAVSINEDVLNIMSQLKACP